SEEFQWRRAPNQVGKISTKLIVCKTTILERRACFSQTSW
ncbi:hypothetical protein TIFTF001_053563, partial [Ficus carica]